MQMLNVQKAVRVLYTGLMTLRCVMMDPNFVLDENACLTGMYSSPSTNTAETSSQTCKWLISSSALKRRNFYVSDD